MAIVKMKQLRAVGIRSEREELLRKLQHLGCVEIDEPEARSDDPSWAALTRPDGKALAEAKENHTSVESALKVLKKYAPKEKGLIKRRPQVTETQLFDDGAYRSGLDTAAKLGELEKRISALYAEQSKLNTQKLSLSPWLGLDLPLETASTEDVAVIFATVGVGIPFGDMEQKLRETTDLAQLIPAGADRELRYFVFICHKSAEEAATEVLKEYGWSRAALRGWTGTAAENDAAIDKALAATAADLDAAKLEVAAYAPRKKDLDLCLDRAAQEIKREEARCRLLDSDSAFFLEGWVPVPEEKALCALLSGYTCCWETEVPDKEIYPKVPIKLKSNAFTEPLNSITEMYSMPAYDGVDPNPLMAPFYVFFFGFMFADLAYGLILAGACAFITWGMRPKGGFGQLVRLMFMCGISAAVIGFFTGGFFSNAIEQFCGMMGWAVPQIPFLTVNPVLDAMNDPITALLVSLVIGMVHILLGMGVKFFMLVRDGHIMDAIWDIGTWWVIFAGIPLAILGIGTVGGLPIPLIVGCLMLLAQGRNSKGFGRVTSIIGAIYNGATGYFGDVLSYSRLMVLMLAGSVIGRVFNILGSMPGNVVFFIIIFIIGHAFNMALNVIGCYVHTSRLQYLEFFKQFYAEGGRPFRPLDIDTKYVDIIKEEQ